MKPTLYYPVGLGRTSMVELRVHTRGNAAELAPVLLPIFAGIMTTVALAAAVGPARRGLRIDPAEALRAEA